jgi:hypothetical protein
VSVIAKIKHSLFMVLSFLCAYSHWLGEQKPKSQRAWCLALSSSLKDGFTCHVGGRLVTR